jgi:hypothetical protein
MSTTPDDLISRHELLRYINTLRESPMVRQLEQMILETVGDYVADMPGHGAAPASPMDSRHTPSP